MNDLRTHNKYNCVSACSVSSNQVIDAVLRRHGVGCMLDWVETDLILKEKTTNIQVRFSKCV